MREIPETTRKMLRPNRGWFVGLAGVLGGLALERVNSPLWLILLTCAVSLGVAAAWPWIVRTKQRKKWFWILSFFYVFCAAAVLFGNGTREESPPFSAEVRSAFVSDSGPLTLHMVTYPSMFGNTASPVFYLAYIRITNLQDRACELNDIRIAASKEETGPWEDLPPIPLDSTTLYAIGSKTPTPKKLLLQRGTYRLATPMTTEDLRFAAVIRVRPTLQSQIGQEIQPGKSVRGWVALDSLRHVGLSPGRIYFRIQIRETANRSARVVAELPRKQPGDSSIDSDVGNVEVVGFRVDISEAHVRYYNEPYPRVERRPH